MSFFKEDKLLVNQCLFYLVILVYFIIITHNRCDTGVSELRCYLYKGSNAVVINNTLKKGGFFFFFPFGLCFL